MKDDLEACQEAPDCEKCRRMLWDRLFTTDEQIVINRVMIVSTPTPVVKLPSNQTYEDWLNETIDLIGKDFAYGCDSMKYTSNAVRGTVTKQANFIWQKLCDKDDQIIKLERKLANATRILLQMKGETDDI